MRCCEAAAFCVTFTFAGGLRCVCAETGCGGADAFVRPSDGVSRAVLAETAVAARSGRTWAVTTFSAPLVAAARRARTRPPFSKTSFQCGCCGSTGLGSFAATAGSSASSSSTARPPSLRMGSRTSSGGRAYSGISRTFFSTWLSRRTRPAFFTAMCRARRISAARLTSSVLRTSPLMTSISEAWMESSSSIMAMGCRRENGGRRTLRWAC